MILRAIEMAVAEEAEDESLALHTAPLAKIRCSSSLPVLPFMSCLDSHGHI